MRSWLKSVALWWNDWVGDKEMENSIRQHLDQAGYYGRTAALSGVRLVAIERPGWVQIYRFEAKGRVRVDHEESDAPEPSPQYDQLFGLVLHDFRKSIMDVRVFTDPVPRRALFLRWSEGLIQLRGAAGLS
ncbi:hypothetical protein Pan97_20810 [Bremerella volcania]|uniref:Uncharacterized protein n=1 Tax=Bremerella volcania TaxID=2527984 RepID=A0A518C762_9BACT|nr:hypothetical protein [Bremerella volcania]QDU75060.1 hypothetical protein Pan97_20810 [Bremerella volcania]